MNNELLANVTEIVKTINVGFDGKLNSETLESIIQESLPQIIQYMYFIQIKGLVISLAWVVGVVIASYLMAKAVSSDE